MNLFIHFPTLGLVVTVQLEMTKAFHLEKYKFTKTPTGHLCWHKVDNKQKHKNPKGNISNSIYNTSQESIFLAYSFRDVFVIGSFPPTPCSNRDGAMNN